MSVSRRTFLAQSAALVAAGCTGPALRLPARKRYDVLIRGGTVFDGTGAEGVEADVGVHRGRIAAVGPSLGGGARTVVDARGLAVAPGFVDIHSHADGTLWEDPRAESVIRQGVTTVVVGQDGSSRAPAELGESRAARLRRSFGIEDDYETMRDVFAAIDRLPSAVNVASMVGLGSVRARVVGDADRPATPSELGRMEALVRAALDDGACGASSGLEYAPGAFASREELVALCRPLAERRLPYATHLRNEDDRLLEAVAEAIAVARGAGCPLQISHLKTQGPRNWGKIGAVLAAIEAARGRAGAAGERDAGGRVASEGEPGALGAGSVDVAFDRYPYVAYQTGLSNLFPAASRDGGTAAFLARLVNPESAPRLRAAAVAKVEGIGGWDNVMITSVRDAADRAAEGKRLGRYAASLGAEPYDTAVALLARSRGDVGMVGFAMSEENLTRFLAHPLGMVCSDGGAFAVEGAARRGHPHPRGLGTFPRVLGVYVREKRALTLAQAVHKMSGLPASRVRLSDRGRLAAGMGADVVVFDPATVRDRATFAEPFQYPEGIGAVLVNGAIALRDGERSRERRGRALTPPAARPRSPS